MKQMSQESMFSDVQLEDPDGRRNSNAGLCSQIVTLAFFIYLFFYNFWCCCCLMALLPLYNSCRECRSITPTDISLSC